MLVQAIIVDAAAKASASSIFERRRWCCNPRMGWADSGNALDNARVRRFHTNLLERHHHEPGCHGGVCQLVGLQEKIRVRWATAKPLMPAREGLVDQQAIGSDRGTDIGQDRPPEIVRDDHGTELPTSQRKGRAGLQIGLDSFHILMSGEVAQPGDVPVDRGDSEPALKRQQNVSSGPASDIQHPAPDGCAG